MIKESRIPIANIFYMLAYAWDLPPTWEQRYINQSDYSSLWELLSRLLVEATDRLFKRGLVKDYVNIEEQIPGIKGKIDIGRTYRTFSWDNAKAWCSYDEYQSDIILNQVIKSTIFRILKTGNSQVEKATLGNLKQLYVRFGEITLVDNDIARNANSIRLQRHQLNYRLPIEICRFIINNTRFNEQDGKFRFIDFERDHQKMSTLFEKYVFNFCKRHLKALGWTVKRETISWAVEKSIIGSEFLPDMVTDVTLERADRKLVIDAKFYHEPMLGRFVGSPKKYISANLYQLNAYLTHLAKSSRHPCNGSAEGMLIYPVLNPIPKLDVDMLGHRIRVESIDLNQDWRGIARRLEELVN